VKDEIESVNNDSDEDEEEARKKYDANKLEVVKIE
jgi:hypothetical protein